MGRGQTTLESAQAGAGLRSVGAPTALTLSFGESSADPVSVGELVDFPNGVLAIEPGDDGAFLRSLSKIEDASITHKGHIKLALTDGESALVDTESAEIALSGGELSAADARALWAVALAHRSSVDDSHLELNDAWLYHRELQNEVSARTLADMAADLPETQISVGSPELQQLLQPPAPRRLPPRTEARRRLQEAFRDVARALSVPGQDDDAVGALCNQVDANGNILYDLPQQERFRAADELMSDGGMSMIPKSEIELKRDPDTGELVKDENGYYVSVGNYEVTPEVHTMMGEIQDYFSMGYRFVTVTSRPGAGKGALIRHLAAGVKAPLTTINLSASASLVELTGGDGIETVEVKDQNGNVVGVAPKTVQQLGPIGVAVSHPGYVELQEVAGLAAEMIVLNSTVGDGSDPEQRFLAISASAPPKAAKQKMEAAAVQDALGDAKISASLKKELDAVMVGDEVDARELQQALNRGVSDGDEQARDQLVNAIEDATAAKNRRLLLPVDKDCHIFATWNPGRADMHLEQSTEERALNLRMSRPSMVDEAKRWAKMATKDLNTQTRRPALNREWSSDDLLPTVKLIRALQDHHANNPSAQPREPETRQGVKFFEMMMLRAASEDYDAHKHTLSQLTYLLPSEENFTHHAAAAGDEQATVTNSMINFLTTVAPEPMKELEMQVQEFVEEIKKGKEAKAKKTKSSTKSKSGSKGA